MFDDALDRGESDDTVEKKRGFAYRMLVVGDQLARLERETQSWMMADHPS